MAKPNIDPETEFWKEIRSLLLSMVSRIEKYKLGAIIKITTAEVRRAMRDNHRDKGAGTGA